VSSGSSALCCIGPVSRGSSAYAASRNHLGAYLLAGVGLVLQGGMQMIPAEHRSVWDVWLVLVIFIASLVLLAILLRKPELDRSELD
jgi:hypothetical protein